MPQKTQQERNQDEIVELLAELIFDCYLIENKEKYDK